MSEIKLVEIGLSWLPVLYQFMDETCQVLHCQRCEVLRKERQWESGEDTSLQVTKRRPLLVIWWNEKFARCTIKQLIQFSQSPRKDKYNKKINKYKVEVESDSESEDVDETREKEEEYLNTTTVPCFGFIEPMGYQWVLELPFPWIISMFWIPA